MLVLQGWCRLLPHQVSHGGMEALPVLHAGMDAHVGALGDTKVVHVPQATA